MSLGGSSSHVSLSTDSGSQAITIHCRSIAWVLVLASCFAIRMSPFRSILLSTSCRGSSPTGSQFT